MTNYYTSLFAGRDTSSRKKEFDSSGKNSKESNAFTRWCYASMLMFLSLFLGQDLFAQASSYTFAQSTGTYAAVVGTNSTAVGDDGTQVAIPIGFSFGFGGVNYN
jgi:hypothetical protein